MLSFAVIFIVSSSLLDEKIEGKFDVIKELQTNIHEVARLTATEYIPNKELPQKKPSNSSETLVYIATEIDDITKLEPDAIKNLMYLNLFFIRCSYTKIFSKKIHAKKIREHTCKNDWNR
jgi:hypothetical protein